MAAIRATGTYGPIDTKSTDKYAGQRTNSQNVREDTTEEVMALAECTEDAHIWSFTNSSPSRGRRTIVVSLYTAVACSLPKLLIGNVVTYCNTKSYGGTSSAVCQTPI